MQEVERYERRQVLAIGGTEIKIAVPMANSDADIEAGTILGQVTASKEYVPYVQSANDGSEVAMVILAEPVAANSGAISATAYVRGVLYDEAIVGKDAEAIAALGARVVQELFIF